MRQTESLKPLGGLTLVASIFLQFLEQHIEDSWRLDYLFHFLVEISWANVAPTFLIQGSEGSMVTDIIH